jgi:hypothetical protein
MFSTYFDQTPANISEYFLNSLEIMNVFKVWVTDRFIKLLPKESEPYLKITKYVMNSIKSLLSFTSSQGF